MDLQNEILDSFATLRINGAIFLESLPEAYPGWVIRFRDRFGVAIEISDNLIISERFSNAKLKTENLFVGGTVKHLLTFTSNIEDLRFEFANLCALFLEPGEDGKYRKSLIESPRSWWIKWKSILGNSIHEKSPSQVMAELLTLKFYYLKGENPRWTGYKGRSHDIEFNNGICEVKSTHQRYKSFIEINSQFQLKAEMTPLFLSLFKFESSIHGFSINSIIKDLADLGYPITEIQIGLDNLGYEEGMSSLDESYELLDARLYEVNDSFPKITNDSFVQGVIPPGVVKLSYTIDLENICNENITDIFK